MKSVVDTNILVSFFRRNPVRNFFINSKTLGLSLHVSEYVIEELKRNKQDVLKYLGLNSSQFNKELSNLLSLIKLIPDNLAKEFKEEAKNLAPHDKDIPIFALALKLNCAIWSNELAFKEQTKVNVFSTKDMIELFG